MTKFRVATVCTSVFALGVITGQLLDGRSAEAQGQRVFELRTYTSPEGRLDDLLARFRNDTLRIFEKHGMENVGYWVPVDAPASGNTLIYVLAHDSRDGAAKSWAAFREDPEWRAVAERTQANGPIVSQVQSLFLEATAFSPLK
jgi:hypothetical protein